MVMSYYNNFDNFTELNINPILCCLILTPLLFIDNIYGPLLVVSTISFVQLFKQYELEYIKQKQKQEEAVEESSDDDEEEDINKEEEEEEEESSDDDKEEDINKEEEEEEEEDEEEEEEEEEKEEEEKEKVSTDLPVLIDINCYLTILTDTENNKQYIANNYILRRAKKQGKTTPLGSINLIELILLELEISENDLQELKLENNEIYDYVTFDKKLYELNNVNLECAWRRYKNILYENEYKDNTYTIL